MSRQVKDLHLFTFSALFLLSACSQSVAPNGRQVDDLTNKKLVVIRSVTGQMHYSDHMDQQPTDAPIEKAAIVLGVARDNQKLGFCITRWTAFEQEERLLATDQNAPSRMTYLELPCNSLRPITDADLKQRTAFSQLAPEARPVGSGTNPEYSDTVQQLKDTVAKAASLMPHGSWRVALNAPVWVCASPQEYQDRLGHPDAKCIFLRGNTVPELIDPYARPNDPFFKVSVTIKGKRKTYFMHKLDTLFMPSDDHPG